MLNAITSCKTLEFSTGILWSIIAYENVHYSVRSNVLLYILDYSARSGVTLKWHNLNNSSSNLPKLSSGFHRFTVN